MLYLVTVDDMLVGAAFTTVFTVLRSVTCRGLSERESSGRNISRVIGIIYAYTSVIK